MVDILESMRAVCGNPKAHRESIDYALMFGMDEIQRLRAEVERLETLLRDMSRLIDAGHSGEQTFLDLVADRNSWRDQAQRDMAHAVAARAEAMERAAQIAYVTCAQTRHVTLGDACAAAIRAEASKRGGEG